MSAPSTPMSLTVAAAEAGGAPSVKCAIAAAAAAVPAGQGRCISAPSARGLAEQHAPRLLGEGGAGGGGGGDRGRLLVGAHRGPAGVDGPGTAASEPGNLQALCPRLVPH